MVARCMNCNFCKWFEINDELAEQICDCGGRFEEVCLVHGNIYITGKGILLELTELGEFRNPQVKSWAVIAMERSIIHIVPLNDQQEHLFMSGDNHCLCNPKYLFKNDKKIMVHNSFDGREDVEWVNEILNNNQSK